MVVIGTSIGADTLRYQFVFLLTTFCSKHIGDSLFWRQRSLTWTEKKWSSSESATLMLLYKSKVTSSRIYWPWRTRHESMLSSAARSEERLAPPWEELKSVGCSNGRLLTTPTLPGSPASACCEKAAAQLVALGRPQIGRHQIRLSSPCKGSCPQKWRQQIAARIHSTRACRRVVAQWLNISASLGTSESWNSLWWKRDRGGSSCYFFK